MLRSQEQSHILIKPINTQSRWEASYRQNISHPKSVIFSSYYVSTQQQERHDLKWYVTFVAKSKVILIRLIDTQSRWKAWYRQDNIRFDRGVSPNPWSPVVTMCQHQQPGRHDLMRPVKISMRPDKTSDMLFSNDLNWFPAWKIRLKPVFRYQKKTIAQELTSRERRHMRSIKDGALTGTCINDIRQHTMSPVDIGSGQDHGKI